MGKKEVLVSQVLRIGTYKISFSGPHPPPHSLTSLLHKLIVDIWLACQRSLRMTYFLKRVFLLRKEEDQMEIQKNIQNEKGKLI